ncbi:thioesterase family protein [Ectothiorhodospiraceae bacterium WFHF3C12]|nr:thioesterase family protein [Ectothiorhodospiraceae bacterium WFHF3C12]
MNYTELLARTEPGAGSATQELTPDWLQGRTAFGGWQAALAVQAMRRAVGDDAPLRTLQVNFIGPVEAGRVTATAEPLRQGRSATQAEARIDVDGQVRFQSVGIFAGSRESRLLERPEAPAPAHALDHIEDVPYLDGISPAFTQHFRMRWADGGLPFSGARHGNAQIYVKFRDSGLDSESHLIALADAIPPTAICMLEERATMSSVNWSLELINPEAAIGKDVWIRFDAELAAARDGYGWQEARLWAETGELVAISRQCVAIFG